MSVGFVVRDISNPLMAEIVKAAETRLRESGYALLLTNSESDPDLDASHIRLFEQRRVDGLILSLTSETHDETNEPARAARRSLRRRRPRRRLRRCRSSRVLYDHQSGVRAAVGHLLDLGHRRIDLILGAPVRPSRERRIGFETEFAATRASRRRYRIVEAGEFAAESGELAVAQLLDGRRSSDRDRRRLEPDGPRSRPRDRRRATSSCPATSRSSGCDDIILAELYRPPIAVVKSRQRRGRPAHCRAAHPADAVDQGAPPRDVVRRPPSSCPAAAAGLPRRRRTVSTIF